MEVYLKRTYTGFAPDINEDEKINRYKIGQVVKAKITVPRNYEFHKKFFALLKLTFDNQEYVRNFDNFRELVTIEAGYYHWAKDLKNNSFKRADSISFGSMDGATFEKLYKDVLNVCFDVLSCDTEEDRSNLENELLNFI